jgi:hypothetical protein
MAIRVENHMDVPIRIVVAGWRTGWLRLFGPAWLRTQAAVQQFSAGSPSPPYDLAPGTDVLFYTWTNEFGDAARNAEFFGRKFPLMKTPIAARIRAVISVVGPYRDLKVPVERTLANFFVHADQPSLGGA